MKASILRNTVFLRSEQFIPLQVSMLPLDGMIITRDAVINPVAAIPTRSIAEQGRLARIRYTAGDHRPLTRLLREEEPDVLHAHFGVEGMLSAASAHALDVPHFITFHGFDITRTTTALLRKGRPALARYAFAREKLIREAEHLIAVSEHIADRLVAAGARPESIEVIATGVDTTSLAPSPIPDTERIVHVARLVEKKGTQYLIAAMPEVLRRAPSTVLRIVGEGPLRSALEAQVAALGLQDHVAFLGSQPHAETLAEIAQANVLCLPSVTATDGDQEGLGQVVLEAGALGRPVVATHHGGIAETVDHNVTGLLVPERATLELGDALGQLLMDRATQQRMGAAARDRVADRFDARAQAQKLGSLYQRAVRGATR